MPDCRPPFVLVIAACFAAAGPASARQPATATPPAQPAAPATTPAAPMYTPPETMRDERLQPKPQPGKPDIAPLARVEVRGNGPVPMVLIPGLGCDWSVWDEFMTRNAERYTMFAVTLPGFGGSEAPAIKPGSTFEDFAWLDNAEWAIVQLIDERKLDKPVIVGQGLGGQLALRLGINHPERPGAVIDIHGYPAFPFPGARMPVDTKANRASFIRATGAVMYEQMSDGTFDMQYQQFCTGVVNTPESAARLLDMYRKVHRAVYTRYVFEYFTEDLTNEVSSIKAPILMVIAAEISQAPDLPSSNEMEWRPLMAGAAQTRWAFIRKCHEMVMLDQPQQSDDAIAAFIKEVLPGEKK